MSRSQVLIGTVLLLLLGVCGSCYRTRVQSYTSDRKRTIAIQESCGFPDCAIKVTTTWYGLEELLLKRTDCAIQLANIVWNDDGTKAGVLLSLGHCRPVYVTYDFKSGTLRQGEEMEELQAASLLRQYGVPAGLPDRSPRTIVKWALDPHHDGGRMSAAFGKRYP